MRQKYALFPAVILVVGLLVGWAVSQAQPPRADAQPLKLDAKAAAEAALRRFREATDKTDVKAYTAGQWEAARDKKPDLKKRAEDLDKVTDGLSAVESAAKKLADTIGKDAGARGAEVKRFLSVIADKKTSPNRAIDTLDALRKDVDATPAGVVGEGSDAKFKLSADELAKDLNKAAERLKSRLNAMQANVKQLEENAKHLEEIAKRAKDSRERVAKAEKNADAFVRGGGIKEFVWDSIRKDGFDPGKLDGQYKALAGVAEDKLKEAKKATEAQKKQIYAFKKASKDEFKVEL
jgi:hypothetical protein